MKFLGVRVRFRTHYKPTDRDKLFWSRFGGGWNWKIGAQGGGKTIIIFLLLASIRIEWGKERHAV